VAWIELGRIRRPYGVKGWLHVESFTEPLEALLNYRSWTLCRRDQRLPHVPLEGRLKGQELLVRLAGIENRQAAQALVGMMIEVARSELPPPGEREYYRADLVGLRVANREGAQLGVLAHFVETGRGAEMVIRDATGLERRVPASPEHLWSVDLAAGQIVIDWPLESA
jgi:16S rRNA processing protein RimM